jgi:hypothetical protein
MNKMLIVAMEVGPLMNQAIALRAKVVGTWL